MHGILARVRQWLRFGAVQRELEEEMATHRALKREALARAGVRTEQLHTATERAMGNEVYMREQARGVWLWPWLEAIGKGFGQGTQRLQRAPAFAAVAVLTLALGIGANTAIFSVVEAVMLRPLPYADAGQILDLRFRGQDQAGFPLAWVGVLRQRVHAFSATAGYQGTNMAELDHGRGVSWAAGANVTSGFFRVFGVTPMLGRGFLPSDETKGAAGAMVLGHALWKTAFAGDPGVVGTTVRYGGGAYTVVGVLPAGFKFLEGPADVYVAMQDDGSLGNRGLNTEIYGRLRPRAGVAEAQAQVDAVFPALRRQTTLSPRFQRLLVDSYQGQQALPVRTSLYFLLAIVGLLLLIACANVASLLLARTLARAPELALRRALGAGTGRLFVQFLTEGIVLAAAGALLGVGLAAAMLRTLTAGFVPWNLPLASPITLDGRVLAFTAAVACGVALVFAIMAAWQGSAKRLSVGRFQRRGRARDVIVVVEIAFSLLLLAGAGLLVRSLANLEREPLGFDPSGRMIFSVQAPHNAPPEFQAQLLERLRAMPGVEAAAASSMLPLEGQGNLPAQAGGDVNHSGSLELRAVSPGYFSAMGMPLLRGRNVAAGDTATAPAVMIVSERVAQSWFSGKPLGGKIRLGVCCGKVWVPQIANPRTVVGVVPDVRQWLGRRDPMTVYVPAPQAKFSFGGGDWIVVRGEVTAEQLRTAVEGAQPGILITGMQPYSAAVAGSIAQQRFEAQLTLGFALLALLLTAVGLYGLLAYSVTERTREIGVRMALGAPRGRLLRQVAGRGMLLAVIGIAIGVAASIPLSQLTASLLYEVKPNDPATLAAAAVAMFVVAVVAALGPSLRATRVDAALALRAE